MIIVNASIDLTKIDKAKIIEGAKGKYYNVTIIVKDEKDRYGNDAEVLESQSKEERLEKKPKKYLGNGKIVYSNTPQNERQQYGNTGESDLSF